MLGDPYLDDAKVEERLLNEWRQHNNLIIAYDFDYTVYPYTNTGHTYFQVIELLRRCKKVGATFIVSTAASPSRYQSISEYLTANDIPFDYINENTPLTPFAGRKVYANILLDDRAGLSSAYRNLLNVVQIMEQDIERV